MPIIARLAHPIHGEKDAHTHAEVAEAKGNGWAVVGAEDSSSPALDSEEQAKLDALKHQVKSETTKLNNLKAQVKEEQAKLDALKQQSPPAPNLADIFNAVQPPSQ